MMQTKKLTDQELNQAIVEKLDLCWHDWDNAPNGICQKCGYICEDNPDYTSSRDLCAEVEAELDYYQRIYYMTTLTRSAEKGYYKQREIPFESQQDANHIHVDFRAATTPPRIRAEALLEVLEK